MNNLTSLRSMNLSAMSPAEISSLKIAYDRMLTMRTIQNGQKFSAMNISICAPLLLLQLTSLPIFIIYRNYRHNVCFRILFTNGITECLQLCVMLIFAILNLTTENISEWIQRIGGAVVMPAWSFVVVQHLLLALNRLIVILRARYLGSKYILEKEREALLFNLAHFLCWSLYFGVVGLFLSPFIGSVFYRGTSVFVFDIRLPYTETFRAINWYLTSWLPIICFLLYVIIVWNAKKSRRVVLQNGTKPLLNDYERRLLIQAIILYTLMSLLIICWNIFENCNKTTCFGSIFGVVLIQVSYGWHAVLIEAPWMIYCGLNPILFLAMNKEFRNRYFQLYVPRIILTQRKVSLSTIWRKILRATKSKTNGTGNSSYPQNY